jgi:hypothetical protein
MTTPADDDTPLHELEISVETELELVEAAPPEEKAVAVPISQWLSGPADDERYQVSLRDLLGAVEAAEGDAHPER